MKIKKEVINIPIPILMVLKREEEERKKNKKYIIKHYN